MSTYISEEETLFSKITSNNYEIDENLLLKDRTLTIKENVFPEMSFRKYFRAQIHGVCEYFEIPIILCLGTEQ